MRSFQLGAAAMSAVLSVACLGASAHAAQVNTPPSAMNETASANAAAAPLPSGTIVPFQKTINITVSNGASSGSDNANVSPGTQTVLAPGGGKLVIQTVSIYRSGNISASTIQAFINVSWAGQYNAFALPVCSASAASYSGVTLTGSFYAAGATRVLINVFRDSTAGAETDVAVVSGYWVAN